MDDKALATAIHRAHALLDSKPEWADTRSVNGRFKVADLRSLVHASERLQRIDMYPGERCESSTESSPCGPVEYHDSESVPLCAECWEGLQQEWLSRPVCPECHDSNSDACPRCDGFGRIWDSHEAESDMATSWVKIVGTGVCAEESGAHLHCERCGARQPHALPATVDRYIEDIRSFSATHAGCITPVASEGARAVTE